MEYVGVNFTLCNLKKNEEMRTKLISTKKDLVDQEAVDENLK